MPGPNPLIQLGSLNRLRGSLTFPNFPSYNITAPFVGREGIRLAIEGDTTVFLPQMVGMVSSQEVYLPASITCALIKTTSLAALFKQKWETDSNLGQCSFKSDSSNLPNFDFYNCAIEGVDGVDGSGTTALFGIRIKGTYYINSNLWNAS